MAITGNKFEAFYKIGKIKSRKPGDQELIKIALEEYDVNLTLKDIEIMRKEYTRYIIFYKYLL
ncbi:unnamed protein product [marine sediment metagenome]|uniref:Uncharacterized protein n=1 Tax=marine sediment metagenome TaxID=412755 RepID=X1VT19_9ZZZZ